MNDPEIAIGCVAIAGLESMDLPTESGVYRLYVPALILQTMFKCFFYVLLGISALMVYSWIALLRLPPGSRDARPSNIRNTGAITLIFCAVSVVVWYFQHTQQERAANLTLTGFYSMLLLALLWAVRKGRWN